MQIKYLSALRTKYASFGLSREALDRVASQRVKTIANEDEIDSDIASSETAMLIMKEMQSSADAQRNRAAQLQKDFDDLKSKQTSNEPAPTPEPDSALAKQLQTMMEMMMGMKAEMDAGKKQARTESVIAQVHEVMKQNGCTNDFIRNITLKGIEITDADTADSLAEKYKSIYDQNCKDAYGEGYIPPRNTGMGEGAEDQAEVTKILQKRGLLPKSN